MQYAPISVYMTSIYCLMLRYMPWMVQQRYAQVIKHALGGWAASPHLGPPLCDFASDVALLLQFPLEPAPTDEEGRLALLYSSPPFRLAREIWMLGLPLYLAPLGSLEASPLLDLVFRAAELAHP